MGGGDRQGMLRVGGGAALTIGLVALGEAYLAWRRREDRRRRAAAPPPVGRVLVFVMLPLDTVRQDCSGLNNLEELKRRLVGLREAGVTGVMVDVWWGLCEPEPGVYRFGGYLALCALLRALGLKLQAVMSFHKCGGNVGDTVNIPLPSWALEAGGRFGLLYSDCHAKESEDCLSLSADPAKIFPGSAEHPQKRDALECYQQFMEAFAKAFEEHLGDTITEIQVGMGPCGELRYPSYQPGRGWDYPGVGLLMAHDAGMQEMLRVHPSPLKVPSGEPQNASAGPDDQLLFRSSEAGGSAQELFRNGPDACFLDWYAEVLLKHGEEVLKCACKAFPKGSPDKGLAFSVKVSGIHWHKTHPSRAAEACAGYVSCTKDGGAGAYHAVARMLANVAHELGRPVLLNFTCLEMANEANEAASAPEDLIAEVRQACVHHRVPLCGENALQFGLPESPHQLHQIAKQARGWSTGRDRMHGVTLLRLDDGFARPESLEALRGFVEAI